MITEIKIREELLSPNQQLLIKAPGYNPKRHSIIVIANMKDYTVTADKAGNLTATISLGVKSGIPVPVFPFQAAETYRIRVYVYDYITDEIIEAVSQEFTIDFLGQYKAISKIQNTVKSLNGYWFKDRKVLSVEGPFGPDGKPTEVIKQGERYTFKATPNQNLPMNNLLSMKWAYRYDDKEIQRFLHQDEVTLKGQNIMSCIFPTGITASSIKVYAYFVEPSEKVSASMAIEGAPQAASGENPGNPDGSPTASETGLITLEQIEELYGPIKAARPFRQEIVNHINEFIKIRAASGQFLHLDTALRKAHFFAQVGAETLGINPSWMVETDVVRYTQDNCRGVFGDRAKNLEAAKLLKPYCDDKPQKRLLNYLYAKENGFGNGNGNEASGDGYLYRGRGLKQLTGRGNYKDITETVKEIFPDEKVDFEKTPDIVKQPKYAVLTAIAYWEKHEIWAVADTIKTPTDTGIKKIRKKVNPGLAGWKASLTYFKKGLTVFTDEVAEKSEDASKKSENGAENSNGTWAHPVKKPQLRGWYSTWAPERSIHGESIPGRTKGKHDGLDLYAPTGTSLYACVDGEVHEIYKSTTYGNCVNIKGTYNGKKYWFFYAHLSETLISAKDGSGKPTKVKAGELIGKSGKTGSTAASLKARQVHLHYEVRTSGNRTGGRVDPFEHIAELERDVEKNPKKEDQP